jgi:hypothetical protein
MQQVAGSRTISLIYTEGVKHIAVFVCAACLHAAEPLHCAELSELIETLNP